MHLKPGGGGGGGGERAAPKHPDDFCKQMFISEEERESTGMLPARLLRLQL